MKIIVAVLILAVVGILFITALLTVLYFCTSDNSNF